jgi:subtilisin family serine protease
MLDVILSFFLQSSKLVRIVIIDTGYDIHSTKFNVCPETEANFSKDFDMMDRQGHGRNISGIISTRLNFRDYCIIPIKFASGFESGDERMTNFINALKYVSTLDFDVLNLSIAGPAESTTEDRLLTNLVNRGITIVAAAGNASSDLGKSCDTFPACADDRIITVGALAHDGKRAYFSNYGSYIKTWENGEDVSADGITLSGTSQATAIHTSKIVQELIKKRKANVK